MFFGQDVGNPQMGARGGYGGMFEAGSTLRVPRVFHRPPCRRFFGLLLFFSSLVVRFLVFRFIFF